jgi:murein DD-endopeptidase MepM/ murein hydrolase activator NlpD
MFGTKALDRLWITLIGLLAVSTLSGPDCTAGTALSVSVSARAFVPGEPLLLTVNSASQLANLEGEFLDQTVFFTRRAEPAGQELWLGWTMISLDQKPGTETIAIRGQTVEGSPVSTGHAIIIKPKHFPEERLTVGSGYVNPPAELEQRLQRERQQLAGIYRSRQPIEPSRSAFIRPVPGEQTSTFGTRRFFNDEPRSPHPGLDFRAATGTEVKAAGSGQVSLAQDLHYSGNTVILDHGGGLFTLYAHLSEIFVEPGDPVDIGQLVGLSGATGRVTGPHLHWGAKIGSTPFDPMALLDDTLWRKTTD